MNWHIATPISILLINRPHPFVTSSTHCVTCVYPHLMGPLEGRSQTVPLIPVGHPCCYDNHQCHLYLVYHYEQTVKTINNLFAYKVEQNISQKNIRT